MKEREFRHLVASHELHCRAAPRRFAVGTAAVAAGGYAAMLAALGLSAAGLFWGGSWMLSGRFSFWLLLLLLGCAALLWSTARALWPRHAPPQGVALSREEVPRLFELIDWVRRRSDAPRADVVLLNEDFNAAIVQQPRLGVLGWHRNYLILGLPLLLGLSVRQLAGVIAHEFGHLHGAHGKLGAWIYRTRRSWLRLAEARARVRAGASFADAALALFFNVFFPRFNARAFVLARQQEYEADWMAHRVVGRRVAAEGLVSVGLQTRYLGEVFWPAVFEQARRTPSPRCRPYRDMRTALSGALAHPEAPRWLREALERPPGPADTHPLLLERLDFAHVTPGVPPPVAASAAEVLLGERLKPLLRHFDRRWRTGVADVWRDRYRRHQAHARCAAELEIERRQGPLDAEDHLLWAWAARDGGGDGPFEAVLRRLLHDHPSHRGARFALGLLLSDADDAARSAEGAALLRALAEPGGHEYALPAAQRYERWLQAQGRADELARWQPRVQALADAAQRTEQALHDFDAAPQHFGPAGFGPRVLRPVRELLMREPAVARAHLVRKQLPELPEWRFCLLLIERSATLGQPDPATWSEELQQRIELPCPFVVADLGHPAWKGRARTALVQQILKTPGACIVARRHP